MGWIVVLEDEADEQGVYDVEIWEVGQVVDGGVGVEGVWVVALARKRALVDEQVRMMDEGAKAWAHNRVLLGRWPNPVLRAGWVV